MDSAEMARMSDIHVKADRVRAGLMLKVPSPESMLDLYMPMHFEKMESSDGKFVIAPWKATCFYVTNFRHIIMLGVKGLKVNYGRPIQFHKLLEVHKKGKSTLTSDAPVEIFTQYIAFAKARGKVLVSGLGLGMAPSMMLAMPGVTSVTVVEKEKRIIDLVGPQIDKRIKIVHDDIFRYMHTSAKAEKFDFAYHDIWYSTGEAMWDEYIAPLYRLSRHAGIKKMGAWGEHETRWQMVSALYSRTKIEDKYSNWHPYRVFVDGVKKVLGGEPPYGDEHDDVIKKLIKLYLDKIGTAKWEKTFDWVGPKAGENPA